jgi:hypothetical protein
MLNKYRNIKTEVDGIVFDSKKEANRYGELKLLLRVGEIRDLKLQVKYRLITEPFKMSYTADFVFEELQRNGKWERVVEDVKSAGTRTREYLRKKRLMKSIHGIEIRET